MFCLENLVVQNGTLFYSQVKGSFKMLVNINFILTAVLSLDNV